MRSIKCIVTHSGTAHVDDFLAVCLLLVKYPWATILRVSNIDKFDKNSVYVDIGGKLDPQNMVFDHHQDLSINSSFILVLTYVYGYSYEELPKILKYLDIRDRLGRRAINGAEGQSSLLETMLLQAFSQMRQITPFDSFHNIMIKIGKELLSYIEDYKSAKNNIRLIHTKYGLVAVLKTAISIDIVKEVIGDKGPLIGVIQPSVRNSQRTSIIRVDDNPHFDPTKVKSYPIVYTHPTGFVRIISVPLNKANVDMIITEATSNDTQVSDRATTLG